MINEDFLKESDENIITGSQVANMLGMGDIYKRGQEQIAQEEQMKEDVRSMFSQLTERINKVPKGMEIFE
jgi:hypothetical protein